VYSAKLDQLKAAEEVVPAGVKLSFDAALLYRADTAAVLKAMNVVAVVAGATTGTTLASALANELGVGELSTTLSSTK
jgi:adenine/guanine phosphoribosyltransferase-like PRPP-binding protein